MQLATTPQRRQLLHQLPSLLVVVLLKNRFRSVSLPPINIEGGQSLQSVSQSDSPGHCHSKHYKTRQTETQTKGQHETN